MLSFFLRFESEECQKPFRDHIISPSEIFYLGETVLLPEYRGQGLYRQFFRERELAALEYGAKKAAFCAVVRSKEDPKAAVRFHSS